MSENRLSPEQLRTLFLFEKLSDDQLRLLSEHGQVETRAAGTPVYLEGEPATCFFVLLSGTVALRRRVHGDDVEVTRTEQRGVYGGAIQAFINGAEQFYVNGMHAALAVSAAITFAAAIVAVVTVRTRPAVVREHLAEMAA